MENDSVPTRRRLLQITGLTATAGVLAGCLDESTTDDPGGSTDDSDGGDPEDETDGDDGSSGDGSDGDAASDGNGTADDADPDTDTEDGETDPTETDREFEIEPGTEVLFSGETVEWVGVAPAVIDGVSNPTLVLEAGEEYTIGWTEGNGSLHNIAIWDENEELVDDLETELTAEPGANQRLTFTASEEMALYVCHPHNGAGMRGTIEVRRGE